MGTETERPLELLSPLGENKLFIRQFHGAEQLGACFEYVLSLHSSDHNLDPNKLLGEHVSIRMRCGGQPERFFDGICCEFGHTGSRGSMATYRMVLRPWLWLLSTRSDCRVFQKRTTIEILQDVVEKWEDPDFEIELRVSEPPPVREFCVQYAESDLSFVMRLLEDDGLYFFFEHEEGKHRLILADEASAHKPVPGFEKLSARRWKSERKDAASIWGWSSNASVKSGGVALRDYDYTKPRADIDVEVTRPKTKHRRDKKAVIYEYPGNYLEVEPGGTRGHSRIDELQTDFDVAEATTDASGLTAGSLFTLEDHKRTVENREYLVTSIAYQADSGGFESGDVSAAEFRAKLHCIPNKQRYRPRRKTPWPVVPGAQTATVVGQKEGEVSTDEYARVQVHFPWNRARRPDKAPDPPDEHCSCWVRVAQTWTGAKWGALFIPRVGQEVVVEFLDGNPDRPLITGCVYNERNKPPYDLPAKASQSGIKTRSLQGGSSSEYNELRFDDDKGHEEIVIQAQRDMKTTVKNDCTKTVGNDETHTVGNKLAVTVDKDVYTIDVKEKSMKVVCHNDTHTTRAKALYGHAEEEISLDIENNPVSFVMDKNMIGLKIGASEITLTDMGIEIVSGSNSVVLNASGVTVTGLPQVKLNS